jgi:two-component system phosphate regulon sensor histidine kinase PhoR
MTRKVFWAIFSETMLVLLVIFGLCTAVTYHYYENQTKIQVKNSIQYISAGVECDGIDYLKKINSESRVTLIDTEGTVVFDNQADISSLTNHKNREEIKEAMQSGTGESVRFSETMHEKTYNYAVQLNDGEILRLSVTSNTLLSVGWKIFERICWVMIIATLISLWLAYSLSRAIIQPINEINLNHPEEEGVYPELTPLVSKLSRQNQKIHTQMLELKKKQQEFMAITENMQEGFLILNRRREVVSYNSAIIHFFGADILQRKREVLLLRENEEMKPLVDEALEGKRSFAMMDFHNRHYQIIASPINQEKNHLGVVIMIFDVTEKEDRENLRQEFTANVSHELKTPLTSISGFAEIIQNGLVKQEDIPKFAGNIYTEAQRLIQLVGDILKLSKLDENNVTMEWQPVNLYSLSQKIVDRLQGAAQDRGIHISLSGIQGVVMGIEQILDEMIYNLCDNAIKYNKENGEIRILITQNREGITLSVFDTGIGIPKEECERIFERFYRVDKSHSKEVGGTGLGLSIVKHGAIIHHAQIHVESRVGECTTFRVTFKDIGVKSMGSSD